MQTAPTEFLYLVTRNARLYEVKAEQLEAESVYYKMVLAEPESHWSVQEIVYLGGRH